MLIQIYYLILHAEFSYSFLIAHDWLILSLVNFENVMVFNKNLSIIFSSYCFYKAIITLSLFIGQPGYLPANGWFIVGWVLSSGYKSIPHVSVFSSSVSFFCRWLGCLSKLLDFFLRLGLYWRQDSINSCACFLGEV